jgi:hypothetical protein
MELLGEEINAKVAVLASGSRGRDADDLAGAALEDEDVTEADVVARDGDGVGSGLGLDTSGAGNLSAGGVSVLVVVTHFGFGSFGAGRNGGRSVGAGLNGLLDDLYVLADDGARGARGSDGEVVGVRGCLLDGSRLDGEADGEIADVGVSLLNGGRAVAWGVNGGAGLRTVIGLDARTVITLSYVKSGGVRTVAGIDFDARLGV